jgi:hypothetical protein
MPFWFYDYRYWEKKDMSIQEILLVTFTEAAAAELKETEPHGLLVSFKRS